MANRIRTSNYRMLNGLRRTIIFVDMCAVMKRRTAVYFTETEYYDLKKYAESTGRHFSQFVAYAALREMKRQTTRERSKNEKLPGTRKTKLAPVLPVDSTFPSIQSKTEEWERAVDVSRERGWVYVAIDGENKYKIGSTTMVDVRLKDLQGANPSIMFLVKKKLVRYRQIESELHKKYKAKHIAGEWFKLSKSDVEEIEIYLSDRKE